MPSKLQLLKRTAIAAQPRDALGRWASGGNAAKAKAKALLQKHEGKIKDGIVNTGGLIGSQIGKRIAGDAGALAGDLVGALITRKALEDVQATYTAAQRIKRDRAYENLSRIKKLKALQQEAAAQAKAKRESTGDAVFEDVTGWAIGNASATAIGSAVSALAPVPLKGAAVAMATVPKLAKLRSRLKSRGKHG